jgi:hypothetical protein
VIKYGKLQWIGHVAYVEKTRNACKVCFENLMKTDHLGEPSLSCKDVNWGQMLVMGTCSSSDLNLGSVTDVP